MLKSTLLELAVVVGSGSNALIRYCLAAALVHVLFLFLVLLFFCALLGLLTALLFVMASAAASAALFGSFFFELESIS